MKAGALIAIFSLVAIACQAQPKTPFVVPVERIRPFPLTDDVMIAPVGIVDNRYVWGVVPRDSFLLSADSQCLSISETEDSIYLKIDNCPDSVGWLKSSGSGGYAGTQMEVLHTTKTADQTATTTYSTITDYATTISPPPYWTVDETNGIIRFDSAGRYLALFNGDFYATGVRSKLFVRAQHSDGAGGWTNRPEEWISYIRGSASPDNLYYGSSHGSFWYDAEAGDSIRLQIKYEGQAGQLIYQSFDLWRMHALKGDPGPPGADGDPGADEQCLSIVEYGDSIFIMIDNCTDSIGFLKSSGGSFGDTGDRMAVLEIVKSNTTQSSTGTYTNVTSWNTPDTVPPYWTFAPGPGYTVIDSAGRYMVQVNAEFYQPSSNRSACYIQAQYASGSGWTDIDEEWISYIRGSASPDPITFGTLHGSFWYEAEAGDTIRFQLKDDGPSSQLRYLRVNFWRMHLGGGAVGPPGPAGADEQCLIIRSETDSTYNIGIDNCPDSITISKGGLSGIGLQPRIAYWNSTSSLTYGNWYIDQSSLGIRNTLSEWPYLKSGQYVFTEDTITGMRRYGGTGDIGIVKASTNYSVIQADGTAYVGINPANSAYANPEDMDWVFTDRTLRNGYLGNGHLLHSNSSVAWYSFWADEDTGMRRAGANILRFHAGDASNSMHVMNGVAGLFEWDPDHDGTADVTLDNTYMAVERLLIGERRNGSVGIAGINGSEFVTELVPGTGVEIATGTGSNPDTINVDPGSVIPASFGELCPPDHLVGTNDDTDTLSKIQIHRMEQGEYYVLKDTRVTCDSLVTHRGSHFDYFEYQPWQKTLAAGAKDTVRINQTAFEFDFDISDFGKITLDNSEQEKWEAVQLAGAPYGFENYVKRFQVDVSFSFMSDNMFDGEVWLEYDGLPLQNCHQFITGITSRNMPVSFSCQIDWKDGGYIWLMIQNNGATSRTLTFRRADINGHHIKTLAFPNF